MNLSERQIEKLEAESSAEQNINKLEAESSASSTFAGATLAIILAIHGLPLEPGIHEDFFGDSKKAIKIQDISSSSSEPVTRFYVNDSQMHFDAEIDLFLNIAKEGMAKYSNTLRALAE